MAEIKPEPDQYYPGGVVQQNLDWNVEQHAAIGAGGGTPPPGVTGPAGGYQQIGNVIYNWGTMTTDTAGATAAFVQPYVDDIPTVVTGAQGGGALTVTPTLVDVTIRTQSGSSVVVYWQAMGS